MVVSNITIESQNYMDYLKICISSIFKIGPIRSSMLIVSGDLVADFCCFYIFVIL